jgi:hypothetical protein
VRKRPFVPLTTVLTVRTKRLPMGTPWRFAKILGGEPPGQTMAVGAITRCLRQYGEATLITALQCVTQTSNNQPGALSARTIKALCAVLHADTQRRDSGLALFEAFDSIDLMSIQEASVVDAAVKKMGRVQAMADRIHTELKHLLPEKTGAPTLAKNRIALSHDQKVVEFPHGLSAPALQQVQDLPAQAGGPNRQRP